jgi:hypothetical protein
VRLDGAVHGREPEPRALAERLGGEEGLEQALLRRLVHAQPVVGHADLDVLPGGSPLRGSARRRLRQCDVAGGEAQVPAVRHGIARVERQVQHRVLQL